MRYLFLLFILLLAAGCKTTAKTTGPEPAPAEVVAGKGQVVWKQNSQAEELVADLQVEVTKSGGITLQVLKGPYLFLSGHASKKDWWVELPAEERKYSGRGSPPPQLSWLHLARCFGGHAPLTGWQWTLKGDGSWKFSHRGTGESFEGYLE